MRRPDHLPGRTHGRSLAFLLSLAGCLVAAQAPREALADVAKPVVHVFLQLDVKASVVEKTLRDRLPGLAITVFGRYRDFEEALGSGHPDAIVSIAPVLTDKGKVPTLQGERGGKTTEAYVLASVNQVLEGSLSGKNIGVVDLFGRDGTQTFLDGLLKTTDVRVKRVAKIEDLLPLLEFSAADGIVLPGSTMAQLAERTRLVIKTKEVPGPPVGLSAVAVLNPAVRDTVVKAFESLDGPTKQLLGVDRWRAR